MCQLSSQYFLLRKGDRPIEWDIYDTTPRSEDELFWTHSDYFAKVLQFIDQTSSLKDLIFYITFDELNELPSYGKNVVVIMTGDEGGHTPMYFDKVLAVFKPYGTAPFLGYNPFKNPSLLNLLSLIQFLKNYIDCLPGLFNFWIYKILYLWKFKDNIFTIPAGYYKQKELQIKSLDMRQNDIFFAGSIFSESYTNKSFKSWITQWIKTPKSLSREQMVFCLENLKLKRPNFKINLVITSGFFSSETPSADHYSEQLMNTKICLVPRGTSFETYRFFEAIRYGCIAISEALPPWWFYDGSPAITIQNWSQLGPILEELLCDPALMLKKHQETLMWWKNKCSPEATGQYIVQTLKTLIDP